MDQAVKDAKQQAGQAADRAQSKWAQMKADPAAKRDDVKARIDKRTRQLDARTAACQANGAEDDAADAIDYAAWAVDNARLVGAGRHRRPRLRRRARKGSGRLALTLDRRA